MIFREIVSREFPLSGKQLDQLQAHYDLLVKWNAKLNLTRIESVEQAAQLHYCESLYLGSKLPVGSICIADIGSGAGFQGSP